jgi:dienelactone hydrolase
MKARSWIVLMAVAAVAAAALEAQGLTWAIAENTRAGSKFFGKLDTSAVAVMGQSCGARLAASFGTDPRVKTIGVWMGSHAGERDKIRVPVLYITGDETYDVAYGRAKDCEKSVL